MKRRTHRPARGMTLVELLVAMALSLLIAIAAVSTLITSRQGFTTVDAASQLRDNARFASDLLTRVALQTGFRDVAYAATTREALAGAPADPEPPVFGFDDAVPAQGDPAHSVSAGGLNGSDVLVLRYQVPETYPGSGKADGSVIDCSGRSATDADLPKARDDVLANVFYVALHKGEPTLLCVPISPAGANGSPQPLIQGVESFQVLYGTDGVVPGKASTGPADSVVDRLLRADQLTVPADPAGTFANWRRVRNIRIGLVLRGPAMPQEDRASLTLHPLGAAMVDAADHGSTLAAPGDGRPRQAVTFTVHLRNDQGL